MVLLIGKSHNRTGENHVPFENVCGAKAPELVKEGEDCGRRT